MFQGKLSTIVIFIPCKLCVNLWTFLFFGLTNVVQGHEHSVWKLYPGTGSFPATVLWPYHVGYYFQSLELIYLILPTSMLKTNTPIPCPVDCGDIVPLNSIKLAWHLAFWTMLENTVCMESLNSRRHFQFVESLQLTNFSEVGHAISMQIRRTKMTRCRLPWDTLLVISHLFLIFVSLMYIHCFI